MMMFGTDFSAAYVMFRVKPEIISTTMSFFLVIAVCCRKARFLAVIPSRLQIVSTQDADGARSRLDAVHLYSRSWLLNMYIV